MSSKTVEIILQLPAINWTQLSTQLVDIAGISFLLLSTSIITTSLAYKKHSSDKEKKVNLIHAFNFIPFLFFELVMRKAGFTVQWKEDFDELKDRNEEYKDYFEVGK